MLREKTIFLLLVAAALLGVPATYATAGQITATHAPITEVMLLPKFCWGQYLHYKGPQYGIYNCGPGMNHYCPSLIYLNQAERTFGNAGKKGRLLRRAKAGVLYTLRWMKNYPNCPLRAHVNASLRRVDMDLRILPPH